MKLKNEEQILNAEIRQEIIKAIESSENQQRKAESFKRYEIYKDYIKKYILQNLRKELDESTVEDMESRVSTINLYKKVVSKKARVYKTAPRRESSEPNNQDNLDLMVDNLKLNVKMKKANKYLEAFKNTEIFVRPIKNSRSKKYSYRPEVLPPHRYDVIEDAEDREAAMGYILSEHDDDSLNFLRYEDARSNHGANQGFRDGDSKNQIIANSPSDKGEEAEEREYIWWGNKYHFTFTSKGIKKNTNNNLNPIQTLPIVSIAKERDGSFWSLGGEDLIDGSILVNTVLSDVFYIAKMHGTGLFYLFGKGVPKTMKVGPNQAITLNVEEGDPTPTIGFANANPQLQEHKKLAEQYVALLLTTNDLEPGAVSGELSASTGNSGVQELIIKAEPVNAIEDDQEIFRDADPAVVNVGAKWHNLYHGLKLLEPKLQEQGEMPEFDYTMKFGAVSHFASEKEKLEVIEKRLDIGLDDIIGALMLDNPDMTRDEAEKKAAELAEKQMNEAAESMALAIGEGNADKKKQGELLPESEEGIKPSESEQETGSKGKDS